MGKSAKRREAEAEQKKFAQQEEKARQSAEAARAPVRARLQARRNAIDKKDFANAPDFIGNNAITAQTNKMIENQANLTRTGLGGLASAFASPDQIAMVDKVIKEKQAENRGAQYESDVNQYIRETTGMEQDFMNSETGYYTNWAQSAGQRSFENQNLAAQIAMQQASVLPQMIGLGIGAAGTIAGFRRPGR